MPQVRVEVPPAARQKCPGPEALVDDAGTLEAASRMIILLGDSLIECDRRRAIAVMAADAKIRATGAR
ncbi:hypothetical protein [Thioclava dalianensis]|uniref:hypothetical protein n=1 Tax=Thioclava dalianensis TaxID=1185766 RepID=UPI00116067F4|nr:hypothetical protein [Thioclava dalianensis]